MKKKKMAKRRQKASKTSEKGPSLADQRGLEETLWVYSSALLTFRQEGASPKTRQRLRQALECNPYVPAYLLEQERIPLPLPDTICLGDEDEAMCYAAEALEAWKTSLGAFE